MSQNNDKEGTYRGFDLFNDIEDKNLQAHNRAAIMSNICEAHTKRGKISPGGAGLALGYFNNIPPDERKPTFDKFMLTMSGRNYFMEVKNDTH